MARISFSFSSGNRPPRDRHPNHSSMDRRPGEHRRDHFPDGPRGHRPRGHRPPHHYHSNTRGKSSLLVPIIFIIVALALIIGGIYSHIDHNKKLETYQSIHATITDYRVTETWDDEEGEYDYTYYPIYTFEIDGTRYVVEDDIGSSYIPSIGEKELILYNPENPNQITHVNNSVGTVLIVVGGIFLLVGVIVLITSIKSRKRYSEYLQEEVLDYDTTDSNETQTTSPANTTTTSNTSSTPKSTSCPGCGSPKTSGASNCPYCGTHY